MTTAAKYLKKQAKAEEFRRSFFEEKVKLDIEYRLEELKRDVQGNKSAEEIIETINDIERFVMSV